MSRIGLKVINLPEGVKVEVSDHLVKVNGPKGELSVKVPNGIKVNLVDNVIKCERASETKMLRELHGTTRANINDAVIGVSKGFSKELLIVGIGYHAEQKGDDIVMHVGYSHPITIKPLENSKVVVKTPTEIIVEGISKQAVGQLAALIRQTRMPEPYKGKGVMYKGEHIIRKEGKRAVAAGA